MIVFLCKKSHRKIKERKFGGVKNKTQIYSKVINGFLSITIRKGLNIWKQISKVEQDFLPSKCESNNILLLRK